MTITGTAGGALDAYEATAPYYDWLTREHNYELWLGNILGALPDLEVGDLLDVGCGTGKSFLPMLERGWRVTGIDLSPRMLEEARRKAGAETRLIVGDARQLSAGGKFDLVWCLDDALNYLLEADELVRALRNFGRSCRPGGWVVFDLNTLATYRSFFAEEQVHERNRRRLIWQGRADVDFRIGGLASACLRVVDETGSELARADHVQRHFPVAEAVELVERAGLELVDLVGHGLDARFEQPVDELIHTKAVFFCQPRERRR